MTAKTFDPYVMELLASRICHDLISPVGAVNNGVEFLEEMGADAGEDAIKLISFSAGQAAAKLQGFRLCYGSGGRDPNIKPEDIQKTFAGMIAGDGKIRQLWDPFGPLGPSPLPEGFCKILMGMLLLCQECLPKGGVVMVEPDGENTKVIAQGTDALVREKLESALDLSLPSEELDTRLIHAYAMAMIASKYGLLIRLVEKSSEKITFSLTKATV